MEYSFGYGLGANGDKVSSLEESTVRRISPCIVTGHPPQTDIVRMTRSFVNEKAKDGQMQTWVLKENPFSTWATAMEKRMAIIDHDYL